MSRSSVEIGGETPFYHVTLPDYVEAITVQGIIPDGGTHEYAGPWDLPEVHIGEDPIGFTGLIRDLTQRDMLAVFEVNVNGLELPPGHDGPDSRCLREAIPADRVKLLGYVYVPDLDRNGWYIPFEDIPWRSSPTI